MVDTVSNTCLCSKIDNNIRFFFFKNTTQRRNIVQILFEKPILTKFLQNSKTSFFKRDIIIIVAVIKANNFCSLFQ